MNLDLKKITEELLSSIAVTLQREYIIKELENDTYVYSDCFITPPAKGEFYITNKAIYEVIQVTHSYRSSHEAGVIQVKKVRELKSAG